MRELSPTDESGADLRGLQGKPGLFVTEKS